MVFGTVENEHIQFNEETLWTGQPHNYAHKGAHNYLDEIRSLLFNGKQKEAEELAMKEASRVIDEVFTEFKAKFGREYKKIDTYETEDADIVLITMGSMSGTARAAVKQIREDGKKVGSIKVRLYRPFPAEEIIDAVKGVKVLTVMDRSLSLGTFGGPLYNDVRNVLYDIKERPRVDSVIYGLGGRDVTTNDIKAVFKKAIMKTNGDKIQESVNYLGMR